MTERDKKETEGGRRNSEIPREWMKRERDKERQEKGNRKKTKMENGKMEQGSKKARETGG